MSPLRRVYVNAQNLRRLFNEEGYWDRVRSREWTTEIVENEHPSPPLADEPTCTRSQIIAYLDESGDEVARVHQYLRTDGTLGAPGMPDPKQVVVQGVLYVLYGYRG